MAKPVSKFDTSEAVTDTGRVVQGGFLLDNLRLLGIIGLVLLVAAGGIFYFFVYKRAQANQKAQIALARIRPLYDRGDFESAINGSDSVMTSGGGRAMGLKAIVAEWGSTEAGEAAALLLGNSYLVTTQAEKAKQPYETATDSDAPLVRSGAHAGLAAVAESEGHFEEAADEYARAASEDRLDLNTATYLVGAARNYERAGRKDEAIEHYRRVAYQFPGSQANTEARLALARLGDES